MNITIIGAGLSGLASAKLAKKLGYNVFLTEAKAASAFGNVVDELQKLGIEYEFGANTEKAVRNADLVISSPGVPPDSDIILKVEGKGIPIISEIEFACRYLNNPIIAVTGTNGKTTTTALITHIFNNSGKKAVSAGNIGKPLSDFVGVLDEDVVLVVEVSSYQLDRVKEFKPKVAVILNITPDHLSYHKSMENYIKAKFKIFSRQDEKDFLILNNDDQILSGEIIETKSKVIRFSMLPLEVGGYNREGNMFIRLDKMQQEELIMRFKDISIPGKHNAYNSLASAIAARCFEISNENIRDSLMTFKGVEHRLEYVCSIEGIEFINDSKATNIDSAWYALSSYDKPIVWIAGGRADNNNYEYLSGLVKEKVKVVIAIGEEADNIVNSYASIVRCLKADSLDEAVEKAYEYADGGDVVLFSPACKSFDMFANFEHRGNVFKKLVQQLQYAKLKESIKVN